MAFTTQSIYNGIQVFEAGGDSVVRTEGENPRVVWKFIIRGANEASAAYNALLAYLRREFADGSGGIASYNVPLSSVKITATDSDFYFEGEAEFAFANNAGDADINSETYEQPTIDDLDFSYSTVGGSAHITHSLETLGGARTDGGTLKSFGGGIGWNGDSFDGVDVVAPKSEFSISVNWPKAMFDSAYRQTLAQATGSINSTTWNGFGAGNVLFKGVTARPQKIEYTDASGNTVRDWYWRATYSFEAAMSVQIQVGETTLTKRGFDVVWRDVQKEENQTTHELEIKSGQVMIERVYPEFDFDELELPFPD